MARWKCPLHGTVDADGDAPMCPLILRPTIAGQPVVEPWGMRLTPADDE